LSDILKAHLDAIYASLGLLRVQVEAMRHAISSQRAKAEPTRLPRCQDVNPALCAIADDDARVDKRTFGNPNAWECRGCGHMGSTADAEAGE